MLAVGCRDSFSANFFGVNLTDPTEKQRRTSNAYAMHLWFCCFVVIFLVDAICIAIIVIFPEVVFNFIAFLMVFPM